jgi:predicted nucleic acid-binding protein
LGNSTEKKYTIARRAVGSEHIFRHEYFHHAVSEAPEDAAKRRLALKLIEDCEIHLSIQVVQEFLHTCLRKSRIGLNSSALVQSARWLLTFDCQIPDASSVMKTLEIQKTHGISYWDAAIVVAAAELGCDTLYTEDLNHGQIYNDVRVVNPFL